jgi:hypothetical protein
MFCRRRRRRRRRRKIYDSVALSAKRKSALQGMVYAAATHKLPQCTRYWTSYQNNDDTRDSMYSRCRRIQHLLSHTVAADERREDGGAEALGAEDALARRRHAAALLQAAVGQEGRERVDRGFATVEGEQQLPLGCRCSGGVGPGYAQRDLQAAANVSIETLCMRRT